MEHTKVQEFLKQDTVRLYTLQEVAVWELAEVRGEFRTDGRRVFRDFRPAYKWLIEQMIYRIPNYPGWYPVWAWAEKPDMRCASHGASGTKLVRVEFTLPREQILFSCFSSWHDVLNLGYFGLSPNSTSRFYNRLYKAKREQDSEKLDELRAKMERSWQRIFDFDLLSQLSDQDPEWFGKDAYLQATFASLPLSSVKKVEYFVAR